MVQHLEQVIIIIHNGCSGNNSITFDSGDNLVLGRQDPASGNYFKGTIDKFQVYQKDYLAQKEQHYLILLIYLYMVQHILLEHLI